MNKVIGITGGIATGKSTVLRMFADLGAETLSADELAREVLAKGGVGYAETIKRFGDGILAADGEIDRSALASVIFADPGARQTLNDITHPHIISAICKHIDSFRLDPSKHDLVLVIEIPLLIECNLIEIVDEVLVVAAEPQTQVSRLTKRTSVSVEEAKRRIAVQIPIKRKIEYADRVIYNDGSLGSLESSVRAVWDEIHLL